jgi:hypothetical protein
VERTILNLGNTGKKEVKKAKKEQKPENQVEHEKRENS